MELVSLPVSPGQALREGGRQDPSPRGEQPQDPQPWVWVWWGGLRAAPGWGMLGVALGSRMLWEVGSCAMWGTHGCAMLCAVGCPGL